MRFSRAHAVVVPVLAAVVPIAAAASATGSSGHVRLIPMPTARLGAFPVPPGAASYDDAVRGLRPPGTGGTGLGRPLTPASTVAHPTVLGDTARIIDDVAYAPADAPVQVRRAIWAGNVIRLEPYVHGGGHGSFISDGYDCSGSVSYVLHAAGLLKATMDSSGFESWGVGGAGRWITVYTNPGHAFVEIAGIRFDTSAAGDPNPPPGTGPRWRRPLHPTGGFLARHPTRL